LPKEDVEGFAIILKDKEYETIAPMTLPFRKEVEDNALQLLDFSLEVYKELLLHAPLKNWKDRVAELWNQMFREVNKSKVMMSEDSNGKSTFLQKHLVISQKNHIFVANLILKGIKYEHNRNK